MILSFKPQFVKPILQGSKIHTIRRDPHNRWKPGNKIHFATGVRTKDYNCFKEGECYNVIKIRITYGRNDRIPQVKIDDYILSEEDIEILAKNDGFASTEEFLQWFDEDFEGKIIYW